MQSLQSEKKKALTREQSEKDSNGWLRRTQAHKEVPPLLWEPKYLFRALLLNNELNYKFALIKHGTNRLFCETEVHLNNTYKDFVWP